MLWARITFPKRGQTHLTGALLSSHVAKGENYVRCSKLKGLHQSDNCMTDEDLRGRNILMWFCPFAAWLLHNIPIQFISVAWASTTSPNAFTVLSSKWGSYTAYTTPEYVLHCIHHTWVRLTLHTPHLSTSYTADTTPEYVLHCRHHTWVRLTLHTPHLSTSYTAYTTPEYALHCIHNTWVRLTQLTPHLSTPYTHTPHLSTPYTAYTTPEYI